MRNIQRMQKITADIVYPITSSAISNGLILTDDAGKIKDILSPNHPEYASAIENAQTYKGIICPGFVNTHCHIELSHLRGKVNEHLGLNGFITQLQKIRNSSDDEILQAISDAENEMIQNGIVAVGDICNGINSLQQKQKGNLYYHSFIELFGFDETKADEIFVRGKAVFNSFSESSLSASITAHAPYSTSKKLMQLIARHCYINKKAMSIHNQESEEENKLFFSKTGKMVEMLTNFGFDLSNWKAIGKSSLPSYMNDVQTKQNILLVHNTFTSQQDIEWAATHIDNAAKNLFWCFCPNANLYIENRLPDCMNFVNAQQQITLGTDSLASNHQLSIWEEIKTITTHFPSIALETLLQWATQNGANYLGIENKFGSLEKGKTPGLNLIENMGEKNASVKKIM